MVSAGRSAGLAPAPRGVRTTEELITRLRMLHTWSGMSYREVHREVVRSRQSRGVAELPALNTVYRCFDPHRVRLDVDLVVDIARVLLGTDAGADQWRQACQVISGLSSAAAVVDVTAGLPEDPAPFAGRQAEIRRLTALADRPAGGPLVAALDGMPGVGKTRLAVHVGHLLVRQGRFADVQLAVDLRGFDPQRPPADPAAVLEAFLRCLGMAGHEIQHLDLAGRAARYRALLGERQALILLDNAASADHVRPLLPDGSGCLVLVTSRLPLDLRGITRLSLAVLPPADAVDLLRRAAGPGPVDADPDAAARIAELVGYLPLALALVAARIRGRPEWTLADHLERLVHRHRSLQVDDGVEAVLGLSYDNLGPQPRRMFRLLALHPGEAGDAHTAAALAGVGPDTARRDLDELLAASLLQPRGRGRYGFHDLVRVFAANRAYDEDAAGARRAALTGAFDYYLHTAAAAAGTAYPADPGCGTGAPPAWAPRFDGPGQARAWLDIERPNLLALAAHGACNGWPVHAIQLARTLWRHLDTAGYYQDALALHRHALTAARQTADRAEEGRALRSLGTVCWRLGRQDEALDHFEQALAIRREVGDRPGEAGTLDGIGVVCYRLGRYAEAGDWYRRSLAINRELGNRAGQGRALNNLGQVAERLGRYGDATGQYRQALAVFRELGWRDAEGHALISLGVVLQRTGRYAEADEVNGQALLLFRDLGDRAGTGYALTNLGVVRRGLGDLEAAAARHEEALGAFRELGDRHGESDTLNNLGLVRQRLGRPGEAVDLHERALAIAQEIGDAGLEAEIHNGLGQTLRVAGRIAGALHHHECALVLAEKTGLRYEQARALDGAAHCALAGGRPATAQAQWERALGIYRELGTPEAADAQARLAGLI